MNERMIILQIYLRGEERMQWHQKSEIKIEFEKWSNSRFSKLIKNLFASSIFIPEYSCVIPIDRFD